jgi:hypothetical protein
VIQGPATKSVDGISPKEHRCRFYANATISIAAALNPYIGYAAAAEIAKESVRTRRPVAEIALDRKLTWVLHDDSRDPCDGHTLHHRDLGLVAPESRRQFLYTCRGAELPAGRQRYQTRTTERHLYEIRIPIAIDLRNAG